MTCLGRHNRVNHSICHRLLGGHEKITVAILLDLVDGLTSVLADVAVEQGSDKEDLFSLSMKEGKRGGRSVTRDYFNIENMPHECDQTNKAHKHVLSTLALPHFLHSVKPT